MPWFKVDDLFWSHPKVSELSDAAISLWVRAGSYCAQHLTDGVLALATIERQLWSSREVADELVESGLWVVAGDGYAFHDWLEYQPSAAETLAKRDAARERMRRVRENKRANKQAGSQSVRANNERSSQEVRLTPTPTPTPKRTTDVVLSPHRSAVVSEFDRAWAHWPKKVEKKAALAKFERAAKQHPPEWLADRVIEFGTAYAATTERRFTPGLAVWLNGERWTDELPSQQQQQQQQPRTARVDQNLAEYERLYGRSSSDRAGSVPALDARISP